MVITIYGRCLSPYVKLVLFGLYERNVDEFEIVPINPHDPELVTNVSPFGKVPGVLIDGLALSESRAILKYIVTKFEIEGSNLMGSTAEEKAKVDMWIDLETMILHPAVMALNGHLYFRPNFYSKETNQVAVAENIPKVEKILDVYDAHLAKNKYLAGDFFSIADMIHIPPLYILVNKSRCASMFTSREHLKAWWEEISSRPSWKKVLENNTEDCE